MNSIAVLQAAEFQPPISLLRIDSVLSTTGLTRAVLYRRIAAGKFVRPVKLGLRGSAWPSDEVGAIVRAHVAGRSESEIAELTAALHQSRTRN